MKNRVITAVVGILAILGLVWQGGILLTAAVFGAMVLCFKEYKAMWNHIDVPVFFYPAFVALLAVSIAAGRYSLLHFFSILILAFLCLLFSVLRIRGDALPALIYTVFGVLYIGIGFGSLLCLRQVHQSMYLTPLAIEDGIFFVLLAFIGTWASDTFAFFVGRRWGKRKMAPHISPNKTIEGLIGGMVGTIIISVIWSFCFSFSLIQGFLLGLIISIMAPVGDLFESYMKRYCDIKDSGQILPGHGGMLDRFDSLLFVAPAVFLFLILR